MKVVCHSEKHRLPPFIARKTEKQVVFSILGSECLISAALFDANDEFYFHVDKRSEKRVDIIVDTQHHRDFSECPIIDITELQPKASPKPLKKPLKENGRTSGMFENYRVSKVKFGTINAVALEATIEELSKDLDGVTLKVKKDETYIVRDGVAVKLKSDEFQKQVRNFVEGKTMAELQTGNAAMYKLITRLGLIKSVTFTRDQKNLVSMLE